MIIGDNFGMLKRTIFGRPLRTQQLCIPTILTKSAAKKKRSGVCSCESVRNRSLLNWLRSTTIALWVCLDLWLHQPCPRRQELCSHVASSDTIWTPTRHGGFFQHIMFSPLRGAETVLAAILISPHQGS